MPVVEHIYILNCVLFKNFTNIQICEQYIRYQVVPLEFPGYNKGSLLNKSHTKATELTDKGLYPCLYSRSVADVIKHIYYNPNILLNLRDTIMLILMTMVNCFAMTERNR